MKFTGKEEVREAWDSLTTEQKESLENAYRKVLDALKEDGSSPRDIIRFGVLRGVCGGLRMGK